MNQSRNSHIIFALRFYWTTVCTSVQFLLTMTKHFFKGQTLSLIETSFFRMIIIKTTLKVYTYLLNRHETYTYTHKEAF